MRCLTGDRWRLNKVTSRRRNNVKKRVSAVRWKWKPIYCNLQKVKISTKPIYYKKLVLSNIDSGVQVRRLEDRGIYPVP
jgi:hypothetical protein